jgi:hypothetical protein
MNIVNESMNRPYGCMASALALVLPPIISIAVTLFLERIIGTLLSIVIFPVVYILSLFITIIGLTYLTRNFENKGKPDADGTLEYRICNLEKLVDKLALENDLLKKAVQRDLSILPKKN